MTLLEVLDVVHAPTKGLILIFDTETNGFNNPMLMQLGAMLIDDDGTEHACFHAKVKPEGWALDEGAFRAHGISLAEAERTGLPLRVAVAAFLQMRSVASLVVAHNIDFDHRVMENNIRHLGITPSKGWPPEICTAQGLAAEYVGLPPTERMLHSKYRNKNKTPKLEELHRFLFNEGFEGAHSAVNDMRALARCFVELRKRGVL